MDCYTVKRFYKTIGLIASYLMLSIVVILAITTPINTYPFQAELMDSLHFPAAILLMYCLAQMLDKPNMRHLRVTLAVASIIALEIIQPFFGRTAQWQDILHGVLGVAFFSLWPHQSVFGRALTAVMFFAITSQNLISALVYRYQLQHDLPLISGKAFNHTLYGWHPIGTSLAQQTFVNHTQLQWSVLLQNDTWQGVYWHNPWLDLGRIKEICFIARSSDEIALSIRIDDIKSTDYYNRFNSVVRLSRDWQTYCIDMTMLRDMQQRTLDKSQLRYVYFFSKAVTNGSQQSWFTIANVKMKE